MRPALLLALALPACATAPDVVPVAGQAQISATAAGATITVFNSPWEGAPYDLGDYLTPVPVEFYNGGTLPIRISYFDLALTDESGRRYAAINPYSGEQRSEGLVEQGALVAGRGFHGGFRGGVRVGPPRAGPMMPRRPIVVPRAVVRHGVVVGGGFRGFRPFPIYRPFFGVGIDYWDYPFFYPPGYASWVWAWGPAYYPAPYPPDDVLAFGLPEGVLEPGARVTGYVYFQRATDQARRLTLTWHPHDARTGVALGEAALPLDVAR
jgi:hypothetical protein